ncbi:efflux RND transporter periplasmic adaptor subunit [Halomonas vilamensis]|uniref:Efflux RND transporter periplasmic adaptor subunit n=1 Tax=Vreelandella vilamensis TaxID=531309 RepID=A0ABU1H7B8_9GAMM|nr:efflux RND transporter periplasmic adaptor subunit [Halomonas vilamensis]MDR5900010.1 efflux RND transporter periplasmic adaptor subunit [Halomonas vilamensis]
MKALWRTARRVVAGLLTVGLLTACSDQPPAPQTKSAAIPSVEVGETVAWDYPETRHLPGVVSPAKRAVLSTRVAGAVTSVFVQAGEQANTGELLASVDAREVDAAIAVAQEKITAAEAAAAQARLNSQRLHRLYAEDLIARVRTEQADVKLKELEAQLQTARSELKAQQANLSYTRITAPFDGYVTETLVDTGTFVGPGQPMLVFEQRRQLHIDVPISREQAAALVTGQKLSILTDTHDANTQARLISVIPALTDGGTGQRLRLIVDAPPASLSPGQVVTVRVPTPSLGQQGENAIRVGLPQAALIRRGQLTGVLVVDMSREKPTLQLRWIKTATPPAGVDDHIPVIQGLSVDEKVVLNPDPTLKDGQTVSVQPAAQRPGET